MKDKVINNLSWLLICKIIQAVLGLIINAYVTRYLGPSLYGIISYAASVAAFFLPISKLGLEEILIQQTIDNSKEEGKIYGTSIIASALTSLACMVGMTCFSLIANADSKDTSIVCALYSLVLLFQSFELIRLWFQSKYLSKYVAVVSLIVYCVTFSYKGILIFLKKNVYWFAISDGIGYLLISIILIIIYRKLESQRFIFSFNVLKRLLSKSKYYIISSMMVTIFAQTDKIMLNLMKGDAATGYYSAASNCATITSFIFVAIINSLLPMIFENRKISEGAFEKGVSLLYCIIIYLSLIQSVGMTVMAFPIIYIMNGSAYIPAVPILRVCVWFSTFSYMGAVRDVWILAVGKQKYLWRVNLCGAAMNIILNFVFIPLWGEIGAAVASVITQLFTNVIVGIILKPLRYNNKLIIAGLNPALIKDFLKGT